MAQTPEGKVKAWLKRKTDAAWPEAYTYSPPGGMFGQGGAPDRLYFWKGVFIVIEVKATKDNEPTQLQLKRLRHIAGQGGVAAVLRGKDEERWQQICAAVDRKVAELEHARSLRGGDLPQAT
jgi:hypothetical protein